MYHCTEILGCCRANNHVQRAPNGVGSESPSDVHIDDDPNADCKELPGIHWDGCRCGIYNDTNDYFNSDHSDSMKQFRDHHQLSSESINMVEAFAGVGAFGNGWRKFGNKVIGMFEWDDSLSELLIENNPDALFDLDFYEIDFSEWASVFHNRKQRVHVYAGGPECTPYAAPGLGLGKDDSRADQVASMADSGQKLGSLVILIENVPDIEGHDFESVIDHFIDKGYHMVHNQYVEHVHVDGCTIRKRVFPTFETRFMASILPPVGDLSTLLPVLNRVDGTVRGDAAPPFCNGNHNALAKYLIPVADVPSWLSIRGDYICDGVPPGADKRKSQRIGQLWFGKDKSKPKLSDIYEGSRVKMDFDQNDSFRPNATWVVFNIDPLTGRLKVFRDDRKTPMYREVGKRKQFLTIKNVKKSVSHLIPVYSIEYPSITIRKFRVPPAFNGPVIADTRSGDVVIRRMSGLELWRLQQLPPADAQFLMDSEEGLSELEIGSLAGNSIPSSMLEPELYSCDVRVRHFLALCDASPAFFQWVHVAAPAVDIPMCIDFLVILHSFEGGTVPVGGERALWCPSLEALPARCLIQTGSRDSAVLWGEDTAAKILGGKHVGLLAAEFSRHGNVTIRVVVVPTCVTELEYSEGAAWLLIQESKGSRAWDIISLAYAKVASHAPQPTSASPWVGGATGEDQV